MKRNFIAILISVLALTSGVGYAAFQGKSGDFVTKNEMEKVLAALMSDEYENKEFVLPPASTDYDLKVNQTAFDTTKLPRAHYISIRTDADISIKINSVSNDSISIGPGESPFQINKLEVSNIFLSSTPGANVKILLQ